jgi:hypothetical protein
MYSPLEAEGSDVVPRPIEGIDGERSGLSLVDACNGGCPSQYADIGVFINHVCRLFDGVVVQAARASELSREQARAGSPVYLNKGINKQKKYKGSLRSYYQKAVRCGDLVELYQYKEIQTYIARESKPGGRGRGGPAVSEDRKREHRRATLGRAKRRVRRLINANAGQHANRVVMLTLTFEDAVYDIPTANYEFKKFRQRLEYQFNENLCSMPRGLPRG